MIRTASLNDHHSEVAWILWICKELDIALESDLVVEIERMQSSVCTLVLLDMQHSGLTKSNVNPATLGQFATPDALVGPTGYLHLKPAAGSG